MTTAESLGHFLEQLAEVRTRCPELRFGQLIATIGMLAEDETGHTLWDVEVSVFDVPKSMSGFVLGKHADRRDQLSEAQLGTSGANLGELLQKMTERFCCRHKASPTRRLLAFGRFSLPMTST